MLLSQQGAQRSHRASLASPPASWLASAVAAGYSGLGANLLRTVPHTVITFVLAGALRNGIVHAQQQLPAATTVTHSRMRGAVSL